MGVNLIFRSWQVRVFTQWNMEQWASKMWAQVLLHCDLLWDPVLCGAGRSCYLQVILLLYCIKVYTVLRFILYQGLYCIKVYIVLRFIVYWGLYCIKVYTVLRFLLSQCQDAKMSPITWRLGQRPLSSPSCRAFKQTLFSNVWYFVVNFALIKLAQCELSG